MKLLLLVLTLFAVVQVHAITPREALDQAPEKAHKDLPEKLNITENQNYAEADVSVADSRKTEPDRPRPVPVDLDPRWKSPYGTRCDTAKPELCVLPPVKKEKANLENNESDVADASA